MNSNCAVTLHYNIAAYSIRLLSPPALAYDHKTQRLFLETFSFWQHSLRSVGIVWLKIVAVLQSSLRKWFLWIFATVECECDPSDYSGLESVSSAWAKSRRGPRSRTRIVFFLLLLLIFDLFNEPHPIFLTLRWRRCIAVTLLFLVPFHEPTSGKVHQFFSTNIFNIL